MMCTETHKGPPVQSLVLILDFKRMCWQVLVTLVNVKFQEGQFSWSQVIIFR